MDITGQTAMMHVLYSLIPTEQSRKSNPADVLNEALQKYWINLQSRGIRPAAVLMPSTGHIISKIFFKLPMNSLIFIHTQTDPSMLLLPLTMFETPLVT